MQQLILGGCSLSQGALEALCEELPLLKSLLVHVYVHNEKDQVNSLSCLQKLSLLENLDLMPDIEFDESLASCLSVCNAAFPLDSEGGDTLPVFPRARHFLIRIRLKMEYDIWKTNLSEIKRWITVEPSSGYVPAGMFQILPEHVNGRIPWPVARR